LLSRYNTCLLQRDAAMTENDEIWDPAHAVARREGLMPIRVDFEDDGAASHVFRDARDLGRSHTARRAPAGPEIDEHGDLTGPDDLVEQLRIGIDRLVRRTKHGFASAASNGLREISSLHAVPAAAG